MKKLVAASGAALLSLGLVTACDSGGTTADTPAVTEAPPAAPALTPSPESTGSEADPDEFNYPGLAGVEGAQAAFPIAPGAKQPQYRETNYQSLYPDSIVQFDLAWGVADMHTVTIIRYPNADTGIEAQRRSSKPEAIWYVDGVARGAVFGETTDVPVGDAFVYCYKDVPYCVKIISNQPDEVLERFSFLSEDEAAELLAAS